VTRARLRIALAIATVALALTVSAGGARADDDKPEIVRMQMAERGDDLTVTTKVTKLFDSAAFDALDSGFPSTVVIRTWVYPKDGSDPVAFQLIQRTVVYDIWDEEYVLRLDEPGSPRKTVRVKYKAEALTLLTALDGVPIAKLVDLPVESVYLLAVVAELNPVSKETLAEVRRWLSQGTGGGLDRGGAFFGSFVSVFVNPKIADADRVLRLRSQPFFRPKP
jgi:hypothetical protein